MKHVSGSARRKAVFRIVAGVPALAGLPAWLAGCSPVYDWREVRDEEGASLVLLPGKPARLTRPIMLEDLRVDMAMHGAQAADTAFTVGAVRLPDATDETRRRVLDAMRAGMVRNIGGKETAVRALQVPVVDPQGRTVGAVDAIEVEATGRMRDDDATLIARFVAVGPRAWQCVVLGTRVEREPAVTFLQSFKLVRS
jgi:hypothetical protein